MRSRILARQIRQMRSMVSFRSLPICAPHIRHWMLESVWRWFDEDFWFMTPLSVNNSASGTNKPEWQKRCRELNGAPRPSTQEAQRGIAAAVRVLVFVWTADWTDCGPRCRIAGKLKAVINAAADGRYRRPDRILWRVVWAWERAVHLRAAWPGMHLRLRARRPFRNHRVRARWLVCGGGA